MPALELRRENPQEEPHRATSLLDRTTISRDDARLLCRACGAPITNESDLVPIEGRRLHHRTNPHGIEFEFGCFRSAPGAEVRGPATSEFSWFPGYAWSYSLCRRCDSHLGWHFEGRDPTFHALILDQLTSEDPAEQTF
jgi:hypothetical protein